MIDYRDAGTRSNAASYCYDGLGRLTKLDRDPVLGSNPCTTSPDESFEHDTVGNLTVKNGTAFGFAPGSHPANRSREATGAAEPTPVVWEEPTARGRALSTRPLRAAPACRVRGTSGLGARGREGVAV